VRTFTSPIFQNGVFKGGQGTLIDITDLKRAEGALQESIERFMQVAENALEWIWEVDADGMYTYSSPGVEEILGFKPEEIVGHKYFYDFFNPQVREDLKKEALEVFAHKAPFRSFVNQNIHRDGHSVYLETSGMPILDHKGLLLGYRGADLNVTHRVLAEEALRASLKEKEVLLREIHHRVKNNMQIISSLFNLQARHIKEESAKRILREGQTRIRSMALIHEKLYQSRDLSKINFGNYIQSLSVHLAQIYMVDADRIRLETDLEDVFLDINSAVPCGLLANELISNSFKHAFPEGRKGVVRVGLRKRNDGTVELQIADNGVGLPEGLDFRHTESLGLQIVSLLIDQLEGTVTVDRKKGTAFTLAFHELKYKPRS
jgi:PAS domain S-box-containing protein